VARKLSTRAQIKRLRDAGFSRKDIARVTGSSVSAVGRAERGQTSGASIATPVREFFGLGKRARQNVASGAISLPSAKPKAVPKGEGRGLAEKPVKSPLMRAEGHLAALDGDSMVVVRVTASDGTTRVFYARGGIEADRIRGDLRGAIESQTDRQYNGDDLDWADVMDITIEEY